MNKPDNQIIIFKTEDDKISINVRFYEETVWLTLDQMAELFDRDKSTVSRHINNVFDEGELEPSATIAKFAMVQTEGGRRVERQIDYYNSDIYATSIDYDPRSGMTREFFATVQNKMHYAAHRHTAAEVIFERVDNQKSMVGMTNFKGDYITRDDVKVAKNYLSEMELQRLNLLTEGFLGYAELQALEQKPMSMSDWKDFLDKQLSMLNRDILTGSGSVSHKEAVKKAEKEFEIYRAREMKQLESDFDRAVKALVKKTKDRNGE